MSYESTQDFKARIALLKRNAEQTGKRWSLVGAACPHPSVTRKSVGCSSQRTTSNKRKYENKS